MRQAVILVGGRGTRLGALAQDTPKPLMPIAGDKRFLDFLLEQFARHGVEEILLLAGHRGEQVAARYHGAKVLGAQVSVIREPQPAGTAGALRYASDRLDAAFLMTNGDSLIDFNLLALPLTLSADDLGALALRRVPDGRRFGRVDARDGRIVGFHEKDAAYEGDALISAGVYAMRQDILDEIGTLPCSLEADVFPKLAQSGRLAGLEVGGYFIDIGLPETLTEGRAALPDQMRRPAAFFDRDGTLTRDDRGYPFRPQDLEWLPGAIEAIKACNDAGVLAIVITNQSGIARGYYTEADMRRFHQTLQRTLAAHGAHIDGFYHCPYHGEGSTAPFVVANHPDRKPNPGLLRRALTEWPIDAARSFMVGDTGHDVGAAEAVGVKGYLCAPGEVLAATRVGLAQGQATPRSTSAQQEARALLQTRAAKAKAWLFDHALPLWLTQGFDPETGLFQERLNLDGTPAVALPRRVRVQARQTFVYALAGDLGWEGPWRQAVEAGATTLLTRGLRSDGGTRFQLAPDGTPLDEQRDLYDLAFVTFALAHAGRALQRADYLAAAERLIDWLEAHWSHPAGGFLEGDITPTPPRRQNPHMHLFEAFLALHAATGKVVHLDRAGRIATLFEQLFFDAEAGALPEYFDDAWRPLPDQTGRIVEPGHHFEWSWLFHQLHKAGGPDHRGVAERLRVHAEVYGVDPSSGVTFDEVFVDGVPKARTSRFWPHTERIKANVARYEDRRDPVAAANVAQAFDVLMTYCAGLTPGLWRDRRLAEGGFVEEAAPASTFYHAILGLSELIRVAALPD
jgi:histidinol-phosphate phosphatase family protein